MYQPLIICRPVSRHSQSRMGQPFSILGRSSSLARLSLRLSLITNTWIEMPFDLLYPSSFFLGRCTSDSPDKVSPCKSIDMFVTRHQLLPSKSKFSVADGPIVFVTSGGNANLFEGCFSSKRMERIEGPPDSKRLPSLEQGLQLTVIAGEAAQFVQKDWSNL